MRDADKSTSRRRWTARLGWMLLLWACGVLGLAAVAYLVRIFMNWAGFSA